MTLTTSQELADLLCDLDGVLRLWPDEHVDLAERSVGLPHGSIHATAFAPDLLTLAVTGGNSDEAWRQAITARLEAAHPGVDAARGVAAWSASAGIVSPLVRDLLRRRRVPVVLVTNATTRLPQDLARLRLDVEVEHVVNSSEVGVAKPGWGIFAAALRLLELPANRVLFVDDSAHHCACPDTDAEKGRSACAPRVGAHGGPQRRGGVWGPDRAGASGTPHAAGEGGTIPRMECRAR